MKPLLLVTFFAFVCVCSADTLRISELSDAAGEGIEKMVIKTEGAEEVVFVKTKAVLGDADVKEARPDPVNEGQISVKLNQNGAQKLKQITAGMKHGRDRLAIIVEGQLISAPVVQGTLGADFVIVGFKGMEIHELDALARKMSGRLPREDIEHQEPAKPLPKIEVVPYTEEEYQQNKANREKIGIFHIELVPTVEELNQLLRKGMSRDEVLKICGKPYMGSGKPNDKESYIIYKIAPEKCSDNPKSEMLVDGFKVDFVDGKLSRWSHTYSNAVREGKAVGREAPTLKATLPVLDLSSDDLDLVAYVEGIVVPNPQQTVNKRDLGDLLTIAMILSNTDEESKLATLDVNCDFMKTLAHNFPGVAELRKDAKEGRILIEKLISNLEPYTLGEKELPAKTQKVKKP